MAHLAQAARSRGLAPWLDGANDELGPGDALDGLNVVPVFTYPLARLFVQSKWVVSRWTWKSVMGDTQ